MRDEREDKQRRRGDGKKRRPRPCTAHSSTGEWGLGRGNFFEDPTLCEHLGRHVIVELLSSPASLVETEVLCAGRVAAILR